MSKRSYGCSSRSVLMCISVASTTTRRCTWPSQSATLLRFSCSSNTAPIPLCGLASMNVRRRSGWLRPPAGRKGPPCSGARCGRRSDRLALNSQGARHEAPSVPLNRWSTPRACRPQRAQEMDTRRDAVADWLPHESRGTTAVDRRTSESDVARAFGLFVPRDDEAIRGQRSSADDEGRPRSESAVAP